MKRKITAGIILLTLLSCTPCPAQTTASATASVIRVFAYKLMSARQSDGNAQTVTAEILAQTPPGPARELALKILTDAYCYPKYYEVQDMTHCCETFADRWYIWAINEFGE